MRLPPNYCSFETAISHMLLRGSCRPRNRTQRTPLLALALVLAASGLSAQSTFTIYSDLSDAWITSDEADYNDARDMPFTHVSTTDGLMVGQRAVPGSYNVRRAYLAFDTTSLPAGTIQSARLRMCTYGATSAQTIPSTQAITVQIRQCAWAAPVDADLDANFDAALAGPLDANLGLVGPGGVTTLDTAMTSDLLDVSYINRSGMTRYALVSDRDDAALPPVNTEQAKFYSREGALSQSWPCLEIEMILTPTAVPPVLLSTSPASGTLAAVDAPVEVELDQPAGLLPAAGALVVHGMRSGRRSFNPAWGALGGGALSASGNTVTFTPDAPWIAGEEIEVTATTGLTSSSGEQLQSPHVWRFRAASQPSTRAFDDPAGVENIVTGPAGVALAYLYALETGDVDGDSDLDIVCGGFTSVQPSKAMVHLNDGHGRFGSLGYTVGPDGGYVRKIALGDADGDGDLDVALAMAGSFTGGGQTQLPLIVTAPESRLYFNDGAGQFAAGERLFGEANKMTYDVQFGDVNGDGAPDLATAHFMGSVGSAGNSNYVYANDGSGNYPNTDRISITNNTPAANNDACAFGDVDDDGRLDIVASLNGGFRLCLKNAGIGFSLPSDHGEGRTMDFAFADFNGDRLLDVAIARIIGATTKVRVYLNNGSGGLSNPTDIIAPPAPVTIPATSEFGDAYSCYAADVNGDGFADIAVAYSTGGGIVFSNDGAGNFTDTGLRFGDRDAHSTALFVVTLADMDGNGELEAVYCGNSFSVFDPAAGAVTRNCPSGQLGVGGLDSGPDAPDTLFVGSSDAQTGSNGNPVAGLDASPVFSATYRNTSSNAATGYRIQVSTDSSFAAITHWDGNGTLASGFNNGQRCENIDYAGAPLAQGGTYHWRVAFVDSTGLTGAWSTEAASFALPPPPAPGLAAVTPAQGMTQGGDTVIIHGNDLATVSEVLFGGTAAGIVSMSADEVQVTTPAHASGIVDVAVTTAGGTALAAGAFTYFGMPLITTVSPASGGVEGGSNVIIRGSDLAGATEVTFGGSPATIVAANAAELRVSTPAHDLGVVDIVVTSPAGSVTASGAFTYEAAAAPSPNDIPSTPIAAAGGCALMAGHETGDSLAALAWFFVATLLVVMARTADGRRRRQDVA